MSLLPMAVYTDGHASFSHGVVHRTYPRFPGKDHQRKGEKVATEAQQESQLEAQRIREEARAAALQECNELKRHVTNEVQAILDEIEAIRGAAEEELEAQRIYAETANIKAMTHDVRTNVVESVEAVFGQDRALAEDSPSVDMEEPVVEAQAAQPGPEARVNGSSEQAGETSTAKSSRSKSSR